MTTKNDSVRFTYETYAKITYVKIRKYIRYNFFTLMAQ